MPALGKPERLEEVQTLEDEECKSYQQIEVFLLTLQIG